MHLNLVFGGVDDIYKSWNTFMQTLNQNSEPVGVRARLSKLSASSLRLRNVRRCSLGMSRGSVSNWAMT